MIISKFFRYITDADFRFKANAARGLYRNMQDEEYLKRMFKARMGYELNLDNPSTFNEKLNWLKLHDRKLIYSTMVDKYEAKEFITSRVGDEYVIPTYGIWERFEDINFDELPNQFVLKTTHDSGGVVICKDKEHLNFESARKKLERSLHTSYYQLYREWPYKNVKPRIIAEAYLVDEHGGSLRDYKFYTFNGEPRLFCINTNREGKGGLKVDYFDMNRNVLDFTWGFPHPDERADFPKGLDTMIQLSRKLSKDTFQLRVDFYESMGRVYCGELTLFDGGGFEPLEPQEWDYKLGQYIKLPID